MEIINQNIVRTRVTTVIGRDKFKCGRNIPQIANLYNCDSVNEGKQVHVPLESLCLTGEISNSIASLEYKQVFNNDSDAPIECIYKFPMDKYFTVTGLHVKLGDKEID